jgi:hypothetical protein
VGEHPLAFVDHHLAVLGQAPVGGVVLFEHGLGFRHQAGFQVGDRGCGVFLGHLLHAVQGPEEVHRGGPGLGDFPANLPEPGLKLPGIISGEGQGPQSRAHGRGHPDGGRAPDGQGADGLDDVSIVSGYKIGFLLGQKPLVQEAHFVVIPTDAAVGDHFSPFC